MISDDVALLAVGASVVALALWGSYVGIRSADRGPVWAVPHLRKATSLLLAASAMGVVAAALAEHAWLGVALAYVAGVGYWIGRGVLKTMIRVDAPARTELLPPERTAALLEKTSRTLLTAGGALLVVFVFDLAWRSWPALVDVGLAAALIVPALVYRRRARALALTTAGAASSDSD